MITGSRILLFIGILMFFIHNHQPEVTKRQKNRRTNSKDNIISLFRQLLLPDFYTLGIRKFRMINS